MMAKDMPIAVVGTFDSKGEEHQFLKTRIQERGCRALTVKCGHKTPPVPSRGHGSVRGKYKRAVLSRDQLIREVIDRGRALIQRLHAKGEISGIISVGGGDRDLHLHPVSCTGSPWASPS